MSILITMVESEKSRELPFKRDLTPEQAFLEILRRGEIPEAPRDMPDNFILPPQTLGSFEAAILSTRIDNKERSQTIMWNQGSGIGVGPVAIGTEGSTGFGAIKDNMGIALLALMIPRRFKAIQRYHTHGYGDAYLRPSDYDAMGFAEGQKLGFMSLIGADNGVVAMVQTRKALQKYRRPYLKDLLTGVEDSSPEEIASKLAEVGITYYMWKAPSGRVESGSLQNGIRFQKINAEKK